MPKKGTNCLLRLLGDNRAHWPGLIWLTALMMLSGVFKSYAASCFGLAIDMGIAAQLDGVTENILITMLMYLGDAVRLGVFNIATARTVERMFLDIKRKPFPSSRIANCPLMNPVCKAAICFLA